MVQAEMLSMKHHAGCGYKFTTEASAIDALTEQRMTRFRQMNTDLMGSARFEATTNQTGFPECFEHLDVGG